MIIAAMVGNAFIHGMGTAKFAEQMTVLIPTTLFLNVGNYILSRNATRIMLQNAVLEQ